ncbi:MAG: L,D-transpeptidase family protein [Peptostreptococcales bacterium]
MEKDVTIRIYKNDRRLELYENNVLTYACKIGLGFSPKGHKMREGDGKTPEGEYYICVKNGDSKFTLFLGISYPNKKDAEVALAKKFISQEDYQSIVEYIDSGKRPSWATPLGGEIGIHGKGSKFDWTAGCIALEDEDIKIIWEKAEIGTPVEIYK